MLGTDVNPKLPVLDADLLVTDLPLVKTHLEMLDQEYFLVHDLEEANSDYRVDEAFIKDLAAMTADVLALLLFCFPESLVSISHTGGKLFRTRSRTNSLVWQTYSMQRIMFTSVGSQIGWT